MRSFWSKFATPVLLGSALALMLPFVSVRQDAPPDPVAGPSFSFKNKADAPDTNEILKLVNQARAQHGLSPLVANAVLAAAAEQRAIDMQNNQYYAHKGSDGRYYNDLISTKGSSCENLDLQFTTESQAYVHDWMMSRSGHRECLMNADATQAGYAVAVMDKIFANGQATASYVVVAIHASDAKVALAR